MTLAKTKMPKQHTCSLVIPGLIYGCFSSVTINYFKRNASWFSVVLNFTVLFFFFLLFLSLVQPFLAQNLLLSFQLCVHIILGLFLKLLTINGASRTKSNSEPKTLLNENKNGVSFPFVPTTMVELKFNRLFLLFKFMSLK